MSLARIVNTATREHGRILAAGELVGTDIQHTHTIGSALLPVATDVLYHDLLINVYQTCLAWRF